MPKTVQKIFPKNEKYMFSGFITVISDKTRPLGFPYHTDN